jgi:hypothetical protein
MNRANSSATDESDSPNTAIRGENLVLFFNEPSAVQISVAPWTETDSLSELDWKQG